MSDTARAAFVEQCGNFESSGRGANELTMMTSYVHFPMRTRTRFTVHNHFVTFSSFLSDHLLMPNKLDALPYLCPSSSPSAQYAAANHFIAYSFTYADMSIQALQLQ